MEEKGWIIPIVVAAIFSILDGVDYLKQKKEKELVAKTAITAPAPKVTKKEADIKNITLTQQKPKPAVATTKVTPTPAVKKVQAKPTPQVKKAKPQNNVYNTFFTKHTSSTFTSDPFLYETLQDINQKYFDNSLKLNSVSFVDFATVPNEKEDAPERVRGETHYIENKGVFIIINERLKNNPKECRMTLTHECIHAYIFQKYINGNPNDIEKTFYSDQSQNHKGIFKEIEKHIIDLGGEVHEDYIHSYDDEYLQKRLVRK